MTLAALAAAQRTAEVTMMQLAIAVVTTVGAVVVATVPFLFRLAKQNTEQHTQGLGAAQDTQAMLREGLAEMRTGQAGIRRDLTGLAERVDANQAQAVAQREEMLAKLERRKTPRTEEQAP